MGLKKGDTVEIFFDEDIYAATGKLDGSQQHYGISPVEEYKKQYWIIKQAAAECYILEGDTVSFCWPRWLLKKAILIPDWEV